MFFRDVVFLLLGFWFRHVVEDLKVGLLIVFNLGFWLFDRLGHRLWHFHDWLGTRGALLWTTPGSTGA
jgi:hypothetical protein